MLYIQRGSLLLIRLLLQVKSNGGRFASAIIATKKNTNAK